MTSIENLKQDSGKSSLCVNLNSRVVELKLIDTKVVCDWVSDILLMVIYIMHLLLRTIETCSIKYLG